MQLRRPIQWDVWLLVLVSGALLAATAFEAEHMLALRWFAVLVVPGGLLIGALIVWLRAQQKPVSQRWWDDDRCDGWRGF
ncbi:MAG: hypothetical protein Kow0077_26040 [Anaerolineae bacterium]